VNEAHLQTTCIAGDLRKTPKRGYDLSPGHGGEAGPEGAVALLTETVERTYSDENCQRTTPSDRKTCAG